MRGGGVAVEHDARTHHREVGGGRREDGRAVGEVHVGRTHARGGEGVDRGPEPLHLGPRRRRVHGVRRGEVREDTGDAQPRQVADGRAEAADVGRVEPEPRHPRLHLYMDAGGPAEGPRGPGERVRRRPRPDRDLEVARDGVGSLARERAAEDDDRSADTRVPELHAFLDGRDAERAGAGFDEGARRGDGAVPVAVGFDDREDLHAGTDELARRAEIRPQRPEAHLGDRGPTLVFEHGAAAEKGVPIANGSPPFHSDPLTC